MAHTHPAPAAPAAGRLLAYRPAIPAVALILYGLLALLRRWGPPALYFDVLRFFGFEPFRFPFLDIHAVLAAAECQRQGIDVYLWNPCDALGRPHVYSPLWLAVVPGILNTAATIPVGLVLDLLFILSLMAVLRPAAAGEPLILGLAALSPMTVYALERANNDLVVFLLVLAGCTLGLARRPWRLGSYPLYLFAGLLKYYPLVLLVLLARERRRDAFAAAGIAFGALLLFALGEHAELGKALANIPSASYYAGSFSALDLPFGVAEALTGTRLHALLAAALLTILAAAAGARTWRTLRLLKGDLLDPISREIECLLVGALLLVACFFAGQNIDYRGIYFVLAMPGLVRLRQTTGDAAVRQLMTRMIAAVLFVAWAPCLRLPFYGLADRLPSEALRLRAELLFWIGRELVWWWLIAGLAAIVLSCLLRMPRIADGLAALRHHLRPIGIASQQTRR